MTHETGVIRQLNDRLRQNLDTGISVVTPGVAALGKEAVQQIFRTISVYDDFCHANDPYGEHDFGQFEAHGENLFFKIDYYDKALNMHSPDPSDATVTTRVITVMLAREY